MPRLPSLRQLAPAVVSGFLLHLAFPGTNLEVFAWIWLLPLLSILLPLQAAARHAVYKAHARR
jgi:hypothetical protein